MAHASAEIDLPARQGLFGLVEVFVDTMLLCAVTALCILVSDSGPEAYGEETVKTAQAAFSSVLGDWAGWFFAVAMLLFGVATVICWAHYGMTCADYLGRGSRFVRTGYVLVLLAATVLGAVTAPTLAWTLADGAIALMTLLNLLILLLMHKEVEQETEELMQWHVPIRSCISCEGASPRKE
jgi:AGCS family alanine or glycine:cation symporter